MSPANTRLDLKEFHWIMDAVQNMDVGLVILDRDCRVQAWNSFMINHSGIAPGEAQGSDLFSLFPDIPSTWLRHKIDSVFMLKNRAFSIWEQRPYVFRFKNYRPITGTAEFMYQNLTISPLVSVNGEVEHVSLLVYDVTDMAVSKQALEAANTELTRLSITDRLTGLNNRGHWEECLGREFGRYQRTRQPTTVVMFDIDHFKKVNDTHGHQAGDEVIRSVSRVLQATARETDITGRYGGEEFGVILINTTAETSLFFAERLRKRIEKLVVEHEDMEIRFTISLGIAEANEQDKDYKAWLERADQALYQCKEGGRNRAMIFGAN